LPLRASITPDYIEAAEILIPSSQAIAGDCSHSTPLRWQQASPTVPQIACYTFADAHHLSKYFQAIALGAMVGRK
jgi:hypothetical protein